MIVVGPDLELDECGLPKHMALELFRPFVIAGLLQRELAFNIRGAGRLIEDSVPEVWEILEEAIKGKHVLFQPRANTSPPGYPGIPSEAYRRRRYPASPTRLPAFNADFGR